MAPAQQQADLLVDQDAHPIVNEEVRSQTESQDDAALLRTMGYKPVLHRTYTLFENFATTFGKSRKPYTKYSDG